MKHLFITAISIIYLLPLQSQSWRNDIAFWVGQGQDSAYFIVDFNDSSTTESYAWGILFDGSIDGESMLQAIAAADARFSYAASSGFLNDIQLGSQQGIGGQPDYWSTWDGPDIGNLSTNLGLASAISPGALFACSYTDFNPPTYPDTPSPAVNPTAFTFSDVHAWIGNGTDSAVLVIDFNDGQAIQSYAWGYLFDGSLDGERLLQAVANTDPTLDVVIDNGFLTDITYRSQAGLGGQPDYWSTWNGKNMAEWYSNLGVSSAILPGEYFGCSYTDFNPAIPPSTPVAATVSTNISDIDWTVRLYPNPVHTHVYVDATSQQHGAFMIFNLQGQMVKSGRWYGASPIKVSYLLAGTYILQLRSGDLTYETTISKL